jgi:hypothetical protein
MAVSQTEVFEAWDPLESTAGADPGILISAQRREIGNILRSYRGYYDLFSELLQNALDAVEKRQAEMGKECPKGTIFIHIDLRGNSVQVTDNGCAMDLQQIRQFLRPNFSFKSGTMTRIQVSVVDQQGVTTTDSLEQPTYMYPHLLIARSGSIEDFLKDQQRKTSAGADPAKVSPNFKGLNGLWGRWNTPELLGEIESYCPIRLSLNDDERALAKLAGVTIYV